MSKDAEIYADTIIEITEMMEYVLSVYLEKEKVNYQKEFANEEMDLMAYVKNNRGFTSLMKELLGDIHFFTIGLQRMKEEGSW
jgi:hypothetical protein